MYVVISGKKGSGKSTLAEALRKHWGQRGIAVMRYSLADPIARAAEAVYVVLKHYGIEPPPGGKDSDLMQAIGDEWGNKRDPEIWIKAGKKKISDITKAWDEKGFFYIILIERVCHPNQVDAFPGALRIRLDAPEEVRKARCEHWPKDPNHLSETDLDQYKFDAYFDTSTTGVDAIVAKVVETVKERFNSGKPT